MDLRPIASTFRSLLRDRRSYCRIQAFIPGIPTAEWCELDDLALVCGHVGLMKLGVVDCSKPSTGAVEVALQLLPVGAWRDILALGKFDAVSWRNTRGMSLLHRTWRPELLELFVSYGCDVESRDDAGDTPLERALLPDSRKIYFASTLVLVEAGAEVSETVLARARDPAMRRMLEQQGRLSDALYQCREDRETGLTHLREESKFELVGWAAEIGDLELLKHLIGGEGISPRDSRCRRSRFTPLRLAELHFHVDCVEYLVQALGDDIGSEDADDVIRSSDVKHLLAFMDKAPEAVAGVELHFARSSAPQVADAVGVWLEDRLEGLSILCSLLPYQLLEESAERGDVREVRRLLDDNPEMEGEGYREGEADTNCDPFSSS